jgi:hypothetical protein
VLDVDNPKIINFDPMIVALIEIKGNWLLHE